MSQAIKSVQTTEREADAPSLLDQILDGMERRVAASINRVQPIEINTFDDLWRWAQMAAKSRMVPKDFSGNPEAIMVAVDMGAELGLRRMQALQGIAVINGRPAVWGDALWSLIVSQPMLEDVREYYEGEGDQRRAVCVIKRRGRGAVRKEFSVADAKLAGLWKKAGPWTQYPDRMLQMRARGFAARDAYADALKGIITAEEAADIPTDMRGPVTSKFTVGHDAETSRQSAPPADDKPATLDQRVQVAVEKILDLAATPENYLKAQRLTEGLFADLHAAGEIELAERLQATLDAQRDGAEASQAEETAA